ncbi:MAG: ATP synthase F0 subunit B [Terracidiphilus sp.]|jgi:F-type H+-transporting ATPase subunit b
MLRFRIYPSVLGLTLGAALLAAPLHLTAQAAIEEGVVEGSNAVSSAETSKPDSAPVSSPEAAKPDSDEAQANVFRLEGPIVKWTAKTLNKSPEFAASLFEVINFGVIVLLIGIPLIKVLPKLLRGRGEKVRVDLEAARKATAEANARLGAIEAKLSGLDGEIAQIRAQVETESLQDEKRIKSTIEDETARIVAAAEQEISSSAAQARRSLRHFAADLAIDQAAGKLVLTEEADRALIAEFLSDAAQKAPAGSGARNGGQN